MATGEDDGLLSRWSKRKADSRKGTRRGGAAPVAVDETGAAAADPLQSAIEEAPAGDLAVVPDHDAIDEDGEAPAIAPEDLPDIDSLTAESDYTPFLQKGVPEELARAALRKLWLSNSVFANLDGLNDYDENFRVIDRLITAADTNYRVGKGFLTDEEVEAASKTAPETEETPREDAIDDEEQVLADGAEAPDDADSDVGEGDSDLG